MESFLKTLKAYWILLALIAVILGLTLFYFAGYRFDAGGITRAGTVHLTGLPEGSLVYVDQARLVRAVGGKTTLTLTEGSHSVIVDAPNMLPWNEVFPVAPGAESMLTPILVPEKTVARILTDEPAKEGLALIRANFLPTKQAPLVLENGCAYVYVSGSHIVAEMATTSACATPLPYLCETGADVCAPTIVFSPSDTVRSIIAYPDRDDALIVATNKLVYVVELDPRAPQYFAPLFKGATVGAHAYSTTSIVISDGVRTIELGL